MTVQLYPPLISVAVRGEVRKGQFFLVTGLPEGMSSVGTTAPMTLLINDELVIDTRDGVLYTVKRGEIVIWREAWKN